uniref:BCAS3 WD40 domain-containing protein n=1 Tax=Amorphochlora amoebiformis TaxID=1561963 RepID=A0A7S0DJS8_9EUKA
MSDILQNLVNRARGLSAPAILEGSFDNAWFFQRRLHSCQVDDKIRLFLSLGMSDGFRVLELLDDDVVQIASHDENGPVDAVELLYAPSSSSKRENAGLSNLQLLTTSGNNRATFPRSCVKIFSVGEKKYVHVFRLRSAVLDVRASQKTSVFAVQLQGEIQVFGSKDYRFLFTISCVPSPSPGPLFALGPCWLAFAGGSLPRSAKDSLVNSLPLPSFKKLSKDYKGTLSTVAKDVMSGLYSLGNLGGQKLAHYLSNAPENDRKTNNGHGHKDGYVTIYDVSTRKVLSVFKAHSTAITHVAFDSSGSLLVTSGTRGQHLNVWQLMNAEPAESTRLFMPCKPRLLYKIFRGITHATIRDISFSCDSRMLAVSSQRGTIHIYKINQLDNRNFPSFHKLQDRDTAAEAENTVTFTPFHRIKQTLEANNNLDPMPSISAFHQFSPHANSPALVVVTGSQQIQVHALVNPQGSCSEEDEKSLTVQKQWHLNKVLLNETTQAYRQDGGRQPKGNKGSPPKSNLLSHVEMNTFKSNEVPFWASPQFVTQAMKQPTGRGRDLEMKREAINNPDYLFWEDMEFETLQYRKHVSFSGLKCHFPVGGEKMMNDAVHCSILEALESPILTAETKGVDFRDNMSEILI